MKRVGFIGTGGISNVHLRYLASRDDIEISALCDINEENLKKRQKEYGGQCFNDFHDMFAKIDLDAVWICTPPQIRQDPLIACAEKGIPVFCEKPLERDLDKAQETYQKLKAHNDKIQVGYVFRSIPLVKTLQAEMADDNIHLIQSFYGCNVSLTMGLPEWFYEKKLSGGALIDQATHNLDLLRMLIGDVNKITGTASNPVHTKKDGYTIDEAISLSFIFENGTIGSHIHTWVGDGWRNEIFLSGEKRFYRLNLGKGTLTIEEGTSQKILKPTQGPIHDYQNEIFVDMLNSGNWQNNPCNYLEGMKSLELTLGSDQALITV